MFRDDDGGRESGSNEDGPAEVDSVLDVDSETDATVEMEEVRDVDGDAEEVAESEDSTDADSGSEADADPGIIPCDGGLYDPTRGLCWQDPPPPDAMSVADGISYCEGLSLGGFGPGSWHLPTIGTLRSLVRGCPETERGGPCDVTDSCTGVGCGSAECGGCVMGLGPGTDGSYWSPGLTGECSWYWSSSAYLGGGPTAWHLDFRWAYLNPNGDWLEMHVRCFRYGR